MLSHGCSSGAICLNYSHYLFPSLLSGICHQLEVRSQDPKVCYRRFLLNTINFPSPVLHPEPILDRPGTCRSHLSQPEGLSLLESIMIPHLYSLEIFS